MLPLFVRHHKIYRAEDGKVVFVGEYRTTTFCPPSPRSFPPVRPSLRRSDPMKTRVVLTIHHVGGAKISDPGLVV